MGGGFPGRQTSGRSQHMRLDRRVHIGFRRVALAVRGFSPDTVRLPRLVWFNVKRALRIPTKADRKFLLQEFGRKLQEGCIGPQCHITVAGRDDGAGSQALSRMSGIALTAKYGLTYVHTPFRSMLAPEGPGKGDILRPDEAWAATWERVFNFGHGELSVEDCALPRVEIHEFMVDRRWWSSPCLLSAEHFATVMDLMPDAYLAAVPRLREKYYLGSASRHRSNVIEVCAHLRRGDVKRDHPATAHRYVDNAVMVKSIAMTQSVLRELGLAHRVRLFSQVDERELTPFKDLGCELCLDMAAVPTFREFVEADVLITTKSSFSYTAAILNDGVKLYEPYSHAPMSDWIVRASDGGFDTERLRARLVARRAC